MTVHRDVTVHPLAEVIDRPFVYIGASGQEMRGRAVRRAVFNGKVVFAVQLDGRPGLVWVPAEHEVKP